MSSSWYSSHLPSDPLSQGDIVFDCPIATWKPGPIDDLRSAPSDALRAKFEVIAADVIVMTQACDLEHFHVNTVIVCPHLSLSAYKTAWEVAMKNRGQNPTLKAWRSHCEDIKDGYVWNLVMLNEGTAAGRDIEHRIVDFHSIYTLPRTFIESWLQHAGKPRPRLTSPYLESVSQSFARYFMRIGLPTPVATAW